MRQLPTKKFAIPVIEANREFIEFLNHGLYPLHTEDTYFIFTINKAGHVANRMTRNSASLYERNEYDDHVPFATIKAQT